MPLNWTKEDFDNAYSYAVERHLGGHSPADEQSRQLVRIGYHKFIRRQGLINSWVQWQAALNLSASDPTLIVGAGFGWGIEGIRAALPGIIVCGTDLSQYIHDEKANSETAELRQRIVDAGLDPDTGRGAEILAAIDDGLARTDPNVIVLQEDAQTNTSRNAIRAALDNNWPNVCIVEDIVDDTVTDAEITQVNNALNLFAGNQRVIWIYTPTAARTLQDLQTLTGEEVLHVSGQVLIGP